LKPLGGKGINIELEKGKPIPRETGQTGQGHIINSYLASEVRVQSKGRGRVTKRRD